jgi:hypothetical protein
MAANTPSPLEQDAARTYRVQTVVESYGGVESHYAAAYAHWADEVGEEGAIAYAANRGKGLTGSAKQTIRRAINAARAGA